MPGPAGAGAASEISAVRLTWAMLRLMTPAQLRDVTEREFREALVGEAEGLGWRAYWTWRSDHSPSGWVDVVLLRPPEPPLFAELKAERGALTGPQRGCLAALRACGQRGFRWRPSDWREVDAVLRGERGAGSEPRPTPAGSATSGHPPAGRRVCPARSAGAPAAAICPAWPPP